MGFRKTITTAGGELCEWHALHHFDLDMVARTCTAYFGAYRSAAEAHARVNAAELFPVRCDGAVPGNDLPRSLYAMAASEGRFSGATAFSDDAAAGLANPQAPLPLPSLRPSEWHVWDASVWAWGLPDGALELARAAARERINRARNAAEREPFMAYGRPFDADDKAVQRALGAAQAALVAKQLGQALSIEWTCADNSTLVMDADMLAAMPVILAQAADALHQRARGLKLQISAATTLEEIEGVTW